MKPLKRNSGTHEAQEPHGAADCKINENIHSHPDTDCGHTVNSGPGVGIPKHDGKNGVVTAGMAPTNNKDQDNEHGPGVNA